MKKTYTKPQILFESFAMSTNIAAGCEIIITNSTKNVCGYEGSAPGVVIFTNEVTGCLFPQVDTDANGFCYDVPVQTNNLFNS